MIGCSVDLSKNCQESLFGTISELIECYKLQNSHKFKDDHTLVVVKDKDLFQNDQRILNRFHTTRTRKNKAFASSLESECDIIVQRITTGVYDISLKRTSSMSNEFIEKWDNEERNFSFENIEVGVPSHQNQDEMEELVMVSCCGVIRCNTVNDIPNGVDNSKLLSVGLQFRDSAFRSTANPINPIIKDCCRTFYISKKVGKLKVGDLRCEHCAKIFKEKKYVNSRIVNNDVHRNNVKSSAVTDSANSIESNVHISKFCNNRYLNTAQLTIKCNDQSKTIHNLRTKISRLQNQLELGKKKMWDVIDNQGDGEIEKNHSIDELIKWNYETNDYKGFCSVLTDVSGISLTKQNLSVEEELQIQETFKKLFEQFQEKLKITAAQLNGSPTRVRYTPEMIKLALTIYTKSQSLYRDLQETMKLPCGRTILNYKASLRANSGSNCSYFFEDIAKRMSCSIRCQLITDEIKIQHGIGFNTKTGEIHGFVDETIDFSDIVEYSEGTKVMKPALYVSQWMARAMTSSDIFVLQYFVTNKPCSGEELHAQLLTQIRWCEFIGLRICSIISDSGGGNNKLCRILTNTKRTSKASWFTKNDVSFTHPFYPKSTIVVLVCMCHLFKCLRNALFTLTRRLFYENRGINKEALELCLKRDKRNPTPFTRLSYDSIYPDNFNKMNVHLAKVAFEDATIREIIYFINETFKKVNSEKKIIGFDENHILSLSNFQDCYDYLNQFSSHWPDSGGYGNNPLSTLNFLIQINQLFINLFINTSRSFDKKNVHESERLCKDIFDNYFGTWKTESGNNADNFLSPQTYYNMRVAFAGAFILAHLVLDEFPDNFICMTRFNQSIIELLFSQLRDVAKLDTNMYQVHVSLLAAKYVDKSYDTKTLSRNPMYLTELALGDVDLNNSDVNTSSSSNNNNNSRNSGSNTRFYETKRNHTKNRQEVLKKYECPHLFVNLTTYPKLVQERVSLFMGVSEPTLPVLTVNSIEEICQNSTIQDLSSEPVTVEDLEDESESYEDISDIPQVKPVSSYDSFPIPFLWRILGDGKSLLQFILNDDNFKNYIYLSAMNCNYKSTERISLLEWLDKILISVDFRNKIDEYLFSIINTFASVSMDTLNKLVIQIEEKQLKTLFNGSLILFDVVLSHLKQYYKDYLVDVCKLPEKTDTLTPDQIKGEFVSFVGFAIAKMLKLSNNGKRKDVNCESRIQCYTKFRQLENYMGKDKYVSSTTSFFQFRNNGGLVIPDESLIPWGHALLSEIRKKTSLDLNGNKAILKVKKAITENENINNLFDKAWKDTILGDNSILVDDNDKLKKEIQRELTNKVIHSRIQVYIKAFIDNKFSRYMNRNNVNAETLRAGMRTIAGKTYIRKRKSCTDDIDDSN